MFSPTKDATLENPRVGGERGERCALGRHAPAGGASGALVARRSPRERAGAATPKALAAPAREENPTLFSPKVFFRLTATSVLVFLAGRSAAVRFPDGAVLKRIPV